MTLCPTVFLLAVAELSNYLLSLHIIRWSRIYVIISQPWNAQMISESQRDCFHLEIFILLNYFFRKNSHQVEYFCKGASGFTQR